ncbi:MAG TPA: hypothetical protein DCS48_05860 [Desulfovibrio sp.]|nr:hypothetical protein [Desulfovibrio sp.]
MNLKEIMERDAELIHLNTDEHAESITWEGENIDAEVIDEGEGYVDEDRAGVSMEIKTLHILAGDIKRPKLRCKYEFNGDKWEVSRVQEEAPFIKVQIFREKS